MTSHEWQASPNNRKKGSECPYCSRFKAMPGETDIQTTHPQIAAEWHPTKNGDLKPTDFLSGSNKKVWWLGVCGHEWQSAICDRINKNTKCPYCHGKKTLTGFNDLQITHPQIAAEWHPSMNGDLTPTQVRAGSSEKVWWLDKYGHIWQAAIVDRYLGSGCPTCANEERKYNLATGSKPKKDPVVIGKNDLASVKEIAAEWHPTKNGTLKPIDVTFGSKLKVWWLGPCGHEWQAIIGDRVRGSGCPVCRKEFRTSFNENAIFYSLLQSLPEIKQGFKPEGSNLGELDIFIPSINLGIEYDGQTFHQNVDRDIKKNNAYSEIGITIIRIREPKCPKIEGQCYILSTEKEDAVVEALNHIEMYLHKNNIYVSLCKDIDILRQHAYEYQIQSKKESSLSSNYPQIAKQWHPTRNRTLTPNMVYEKSGKKVWWLGDCGHEWIEKIANRTSRNFGCPYCNGRSTLTGFNDLATVNPKLATEWHPTRNGTLKPTNVRGKSNKKVWWICPLNHEWEAKIEDRMNGSGCPYCKNKRVLKGYNDLATVNPELASQWHPTRNGLLNPTDIVAGSCKKIWWRCPYGHEWIAEVDSRNRGTGCPYCKNRTSKKQHRFANYFV